MQQPVIQKAPIILYPKLMVANVNENLIVLATNDGKGVVLSSGGSSHKVGEIFTLHKPHYTDFVGKITLEN